jgi:carbon storage regulator
MLVLTRRNNEAVVIGGSDSFESMLKVTVLDIRVGRVRLGFEASKDVPVHRWEVWEKTQAVSQPECLSEAPIERIA